MCFTSLGLNVLHVVVVDTQIAIIKFVGVLICGGLLLVPYHYSYGVDLIWKPILVRGLLVYIIIQG